MPWKNLPSATLRSRDQPVGILAGTEVDAHWRQVGCRLFHWETPSPYMRSMCLHWVLVDICSISALGKIEINLMDLGSKME